MNHNSGYFATLLATFGIWVQNSGLYKLWCRIYENTARAWKTGRIPSWFRNQHYTDDAVSKSLIGRVLGFPFTLLHWLQKSIGKQLATGLENSKIIQICKLYLHHLLALNLRFMGLLFLGCGLGLGIAGQFIFHWLWTILVILGAVLALFDVNVADWLTHSKLLVFLCRSFGIMTDFHWYHDHLIAGKLRWVIACVAGLLCGLARGLTNPLLGVAMLAGLAGVFLILERPIAGLFLVVFLAPLAPTMIMAGLSLLSLGSLVIMSLTHENFRWRYDGLGFLLLAFVVVYLFSAITSFAVVKSLSIWAIYVAFISAYFLVIHLITTKKQLSQLLVTFVCSGFLVCLYGIAQYIFGWNTSQAWMDEAMFSDIKMRIYSTLENPNVLGEYILLVLPVSVGLAYFFKSAWTKTVYAAISGIMLVALILTFSRGCWIGLLVAAVILITFAAGKLWGLSFLVLPLVPFLLPESIITRFTSIGNMEDSSTSYRVYIWMGTLAMVRDFWLSGIGMGSESFTQVYPFYSYNQIVAPHSHNLFLQILVESGVVGIVLFLAIVALFLKKAMVGFQWGGGKGKPLSVILTAICAGICGFLVQGMFDNCFYNYRVFLIFWLVLGIAMALCYVAKSLTDVEKEDFLC